MSKHNSAQLNRNADNSESVALQQIESDSPTIYLPNPEAIARIKETSPEVLQWIIEQTTAEALHRREMDERQWTHLTVWRTLGQIFGFLIGIGGIIAGALVAIYSSPTAGGTIATVSIGTLAVAFLGKTKKSP